MPAKLGSEERGRDPDTHDPLAERLEASRARRLQERDSAARARALNTPMSAAQVRADSASDQADEGASSARSSLVFDDRANARARPSAEGGNIPKELPPWYGMMGKLWSSSATSLITFSGTPSLRSDISFPVVRSTLS